MPRATELSSQFRARVGKHYQPELEKGLDCQCKGALQGKKDVMSQRLPTYAECRRGESLLTKHSQGAVDSTDHSRKRRV